MNSLRVEALPAKCKWQGTLVSFLLFVASPALFSATHKPAAPDVKGRAVQSDTLPSEINLSAPELNLTKEGEHKAEALASFVTALIDEGNSEPDAALEKFRKTLNFDPGYTDLAVKVAMELARRGDPSTAVNLLKDAIKAAPSEVICYLCLAQIYDRNFKKPDLAIKYASQALDLNPKNPAPFLTLYELYTATNREKNAQAILDRALKLENTMPEYWLQLGGFLTRLNAKDNGKTEPEDLKKMKSVFQKALACADDDPDIMTRVADFYAVIKDQKAAIPLYRKALELKKNRGELPEAAIEIKLASSLRADGQTDEAIAQLKQCGRDNPLNLDIYEMLGEIYEGKSDYNNALASYQQALLIDSIQPVNYLRVADMFLKTMQAGKAVDLLAEARAKFPDMPQITFSLAVAQSQAKRFKEAVFTFEEALHEAENVAPDMLNSAFYFAYGAAVEQSGDVKKAADLMRKSIDLDPGNSAEACNYLGYMWVDHGENLDQAASFIKRALEKDPENPAFLDSLGWYYFKTGDYAKALDQLKKAAATIQPEDAVVDEHLGDTYLKLNDPEQALSFWKKAAVIDPDNKSVAAKIGNAKGGSNPPQNH